MTNLIEVKNIRKKFCKSAELASRYGLRDIFHHFIGYRNGSASLREHEFWVLKDLSFGLARGEVLGIIGKNGAGKSTLLRLLQGIYEPDHGEISLTGRMTELVELGTCFHQDYTGRENIRINAAVLGLKDHETNRWMDSIVSFADIGDFIDSPVKYYSSGMRMRLAFSVAVHCPSEILLIDEVLAVGDADFIAKCKQKIRSMIDAGTSVILVSHNLPLVEELCTRVLWLHQGEVRHIGQPAETIQMYQKTDR